MLDCADERVFLEYLIDTDWSKAICNPAVWATTCVIFVHVFAQVLYAEIARRLLGMRDWLITICDTTLHELSSKHLLKTELNSFALCLPFTHTFAGLAIGYYYTARANVPLSWIFKSFFNTPRAKGIWIQTSYPQCSLTFFLGAQARLTIALFAPLRVTCFGRTPHSGHSPSFLLSCGSYIFSADRPASVIM
jgi:hypothetical protein